MTNAMRALRQAHEGARMASAWPTAPRSDRLAAAVPRRRHRAPSAAVTTWRPAPDRSSSAIAAAPSSSSSDASQPSTPNTTTACWSFTSPSQRVRDYELDAYSVVNNGVYASLFQDARHLALEAMCGTSVTQYQERGVLMALSELVIRYKAPLRSGDSYVSRVRVESVGGARVTLAQQVVRVVLVGADGDGGEEEVVAAEGSATVVFLDERYRPARMPEDARRAFERTMGAGT